ncbi:MAG: hypothetical protein R3E82_04550 [Pseudomonadales bacterium]
MPKEINRIIGRVGSTFMAGAALLWCGTTSGAESAALPAPADAAEASIADILGETDADLVQIQSQIEAGEYDIPRAWLKLKIDEIENQTHRFDPALVRPITLLGDIQAREGDYTGALDTYGRAVHLERVSAGLVSPGQVDIVYREAEVYRALGDLKAANEREEYAYHVLTRAHDSYDEALLPGIYHLAQWYTSTHNIYAARALYQQAIAILDANGKGLDRAAIRPLSGLAKTYQLERFPPFYVSASDESVYSTGIPSRTSDLHAPIVINNFPAGESALQAIVQIHRDLGDEVPVVAEAIIDLADWYLLFDKSRRAFPLYQHAYELLESQEAGSGAAFFAEPQLLYFPDPGDPKPSNAQATNVAQGHVSLMFNLTDEGEIRDLRTVASEPEGMMEFRVRKSMRIARYRPPLLNQVPQPSTDVTLVHKFSYYPQLVAADTARPETAEPAATTAEQITREPAP